jgi:regulator of protease activity HflC (stomatin/prohibitin superfamily)
MTTNDKGFVQLIAIGAVCAGALTLVLWGMPQLGVYNRTLAGKAALMEAESTRQVRVLEAKAKQESAELEANAEVTRAEGSAKAIAALKKELGNSESYLRWLYIQGLQEQANGNGEKTVVYIPTDGLVPLPISEAGRVK